MNRKILLIHPPAKSIRFFTANFPIALATISPLLRKEGWDVKVIDANLEDLSRSQVLSRLRKEVLRADVVGVTANMNAYSYIEWIAGQVKSLRPDLPVIAGGPGPADVAPLG